MLSSVTLSIQLPKPSPKGHTTVTFRSFKHFSETNFLFNLSQQPFRNVYTHCDPEEALALLYDIFKTVIDRHAPVQQRRLKNTKPCLWLTPESIRETKKRCHLKHNRQFDGYKKQRNKESMYRPKLKKQKGSISVN